MNKIYKYTACLLITLMPFFSSCEDMFGDYLDKQLSDQLTEKEVFSQWTTTMQFHYDTYNFLRDGAGRINSSWLDGATDLAHTSYSWGGVRSSFNIGNYYTSTAYSELEGSWEHYYRGIRKCNMLLSHIDSVPKAADLSEERYLIDKANYKAESRFLRVYFYWEMFLRYGPVPMITEVLDPDGDLLKYSERPELRTYITWLLEELADLEGDLMDKPVETDLQGRISKPMPRALASRIKLYMASDRFRAQSGISWQDAADAAQSFITEYGDSYGLYRGDADPVLCYTNAILKNAHDQSNNEVIFWRNEVMKGWSAIVNDTPVGEGGNGGLCPSQNLVDMYDMINGESPFASYDKTGAPVYEGVNTPAINPNSEYDDNNPYIKRDPRLSASVLFHGTDWGNGVINVVKGQRDNPIGNANATPTGYYLRKYIPQNILDNNHAGTAYRNWIFIRYAEILLNYAEAMNEVEGASASVFAALQQIRDRVGMTTLLSGRSDLKTQEALRNFIRKERTVELAFEEHRFWDVRRWDVAQEALSRPIYGMEVTEGGNRYTRKIAAERKFEPKMYLYPIPEGEVWKTNIENNPGWN